MVKGWWLAMLAMPSSCWTGGGASTHRAQQLAADRFGEIFGEIEGGSFGSDQSHTWDLDRDISRCLGKS